MPDVMDDITATIAGLQGDDVGRVSSLFYANDGAIGSKDHEWLQNATQHLCNLFRDCTGLKPNTEKTKTMSISTSTVLGISSYISGQCDYFTCPSFFSGWSNQKTVVGECLFHF